MNFISVPSMQKSVLFERPTWLACGSYLSQNDLRVHFGLGSATRMDKVGANEITRQWLKLRGRSTPTISLSTIGRATALGAWRHSRRTSINFTCLGLATTTSWPSALSNRLTHGECVPTSRAIRQRPVEPNTLAIAFLFVLTRTLCFAKMTSDFKNQRIRRP